MNRKEMPDPCLIGYSCYEETLSVSLNYYDELYSALNYNIPLFIYDYASMVKFDFEKPPGEYLLTNNLLLFNNIGLPASQYKKDFNSVISLLSSNFCENKIHRIDDISSIDFDENLNRKLCISVLVDPYYLEPDYSVYNSRMKDAKRHLSHYINVLKFDASTNACHIIDANFNINNYVSAENLNLAYTAVEDRSIFTFEPSVKDNAKVEIPRILYMHLLWGIKNDIVINNKVYKANANAVSNYASEFECMVETLEKDVGQYVPQYMSYPLIGYRHMIKGNYYLYNYLATKHNLSFLSRLVEISKEYNDNWMIYDVKLDKSFLKGKRIYDEIRDYKDLLQRMSLLATSLQAETSRCLDYLSKTSTIVETNNLVSL
jgi:hypothetical protein